MVTVDDETTTAGIVNIFRTLMTLFETMRPRDASCMPVWSMVSFNSSLQCLEPSLLLLVTSASDLPLRIRHRSESQILVV